MQNKAYIGSVNTAHIVGKMYIGVDNKARRIKKAYVGDENGLARRLFYNGIATFPEWTEATLPITDKFYSAAYGAGKFVAIAESRKIVYSIDGINWKQAVTPAASGVCIGLAYGAGKFVAITWNHYFLVSSDGINWTASMPFSNYGWNDVVYANGAFLAVGSNPGVGRYVARSVDGVNWTSEYIGDGMPQSIVGGGGRFLLYSSSRLYYSENGLSWIETPSPLSDQGGSVGHIAYGNGIFLLFASRECFASTNGTNWSKVTHPQYSFLNEKLSFLSNRFFLHGYGDEILSSADGIDWQTTDLPESGAWYCMGYGDGRLVMFGYNSNKALCSILDQ